MDELTEYLANSAEDGFWDQIQSEARREADREPVLGGFLYASVLRHKKLEDGLSALLAKKLHTPDLPASLLGDLILGAMSEDASMRASIRADLMAARTRDPAARGYAQPFLYLWVTSRLGSGPKSPLAALCSETCRRTPPWPEYPRVSSGAAPWPSRPWRWTPPSRSRTAARVSDPDAADCPHQAQLLAAGRSVLLKPG